MYNLRKGIAVFASAATLFGMTAVAGVGSGVAFAQTAAPTNAFSDIASSPYAREINWLAGLGFVSGDNGTLLTCTSNCTYRPDSNVTRAEFVKYVDEMAGLGGAATALSNVTPNFTDGSSIPSWAWGFVNVAQSNKYVVGYPDGSFQAGNNITFAEALQVLLRVDGLGPAVTGPWPVGPVAAGAHYGMNVDLSAKDQTLAFNAPITRGEMAALVFDAYLKAPTGQVNVSTGVFQDNLAPLVYVSPANTQTVSCTGTVSGVPSSNGGIMLTASSLTEFTAATNTGSCAPQLYQKFAANPPVAAQFSQNVWLDGAANFAELAGQTATLTTDTNGNIDAVLVRDQSAASTSVTPLGLNNGTSTTPTGYSEVTITGTQGAQQAPYLITDSSGNYYLFGANGTSQEINNPAQFFINNAPVITSGSDSDADDAGGIDTDNDETATTTSPLTAFTDIVNSAFGGNVIASGIEYAQATWSIQKGETGATSVYLYTNTYPHALLQSINAPNFTIEAFSNGNSYTLSAGDSTSIFLNGKPATLSDLQANDVVDVQLQSNLSCASSGSCTNPVLYVYDTRNVVTGSVTDIANGPGYSDATVQTSSGQTQQIQLNSSAAVNFATLVPGTPVELALDSNGQAYWNLYNTSPNTWTPIVSEAMGVGRDNSGNYNVSLDSAGATTSSLIESDAQAGLNALVGNSQAFDPFVVVNTTNTNSSNTAITDTVPVYGNSSIYGAGSGTTGNNEPAAISSVLPTVGPDTNGKIEFNSGEIAGVTPLAPLFDMSSVPAKPAASTTCTTDAGLVVTTVYAVTYTQCSDVYQVSAVDSTNGIVALQELDGATGAPTGNMFTAYVSNGLTVFSQSNIAAGTAGQYLGVSGLTVGNKVALWGGSLNKSGHVVGVPVDNAGALSGTYTAGWTADSYAPEGVAASGAMNVPVANPTGATVLGMVRLP